MRGRPWRKARADLPDDERVQWVADLMRAGWQVATALRLKDFQALSQARQAVDTAKHGLGERGPVWWSDGVPDYNRRLVSKTPYADWYAALNAE